MQNELNETVFEDHIAQYLAASDAYRTDGRNKASKELAIQLNCTLDDMVVYLPCI